MTTPEEEGDTAVTSAGGSGAPEKPAAPAAPVAADYDRRYYASGLGPRYDESEPHWTQFFGSVADGIIRQLSPESVLDAGCATGFLVAALAKRGVDASGVDISDYAVASAVSGAEGRIRVQSLSEPLQGRWDLVTCIEVLEHMPGVDLQTAIDHLCQASDRILFSSTPHDYTEASHVSVKPVATWVSWFAERGFFRRADLDVSYVSPWAMILERGRPTLAELVHAYETRMSPLLEEVVAMRTALLESDRQVGELTDRLQAGKGLLADDDEQFRSIERTISLIDQVIGLQTELAEERYRHDRGLRTFHDTIEELQERVEAADLRVAEVLASRSWRFGQILMSPAHQLRRLFRRKG